MTSLTVVLPTYNRATWTTLAIQSVVETQHLVHPHHEIELVVVDDGSTDGSVDTLVGLRRQYPFTLLKLSKNSRKRGAIEAALALVHSEWLMELSSDDLVIPTGLQAVLDVAERHPSTSVVFADHTVMDADGIYDKIAHLRMRALTGRADLEPGPIADARGAGLVRGTIPGGVGALVRAEPIPPRVPWWVRTKTDYWLLWRALRYNPAAYYVDVQAIHCRMHSSNTSATGGVAKAIMRLIFAVALALDPRATGIRCGLIKRAALSARHVLGESVRSVQTHATAHAESGDGRSTPTCSRS